MAGRKHRGLVDMSPEAITRRMERMRQDDGDPETWDVHHWQEINPVHTEALVQLTCGGPQIIYHGGLLHVNRERFFRVGARSRGEHMNAGCQRRKIERCGPLRLVASCDR